MGYLDKTTITVDAILTKKGRELLAKGSEFFNITQFALGDDEIDYGLYDVNHQLGTNYYGQAIEALPLVEAVPNENYVMKHKLVTLPKNISRMPTVTVGVTKLQLLQTLPTLQMVTEHTAIQQFLQILMLHILMLHQVVE